MPRENGRERYGSETMFAPWLLDQCRTATCALESRACAVVGPKCPREDWPETIDIARQEVDIFPAVRIFRFIFVIPEKGIPFTLAGKQGSITSRSALASRAKGNRNTNPI
jgi:hypothetical protein